MGPEFGEGADVAVGVGVVDALVPAAGAYGKVRVVADGGEGGLQDAVLPGLGVLGHEEDVALALDPDLMDEAGEAGGVGEVDVGIGFDAVAVAA